MSKKKQVKPVEKTGNGRAREGKADFVREILTRKSNKVTMLEAIVIYTQAYPAVKSLTARHTLSWYASQLRTAGEAVTLLPRVPASKPAKPASEPAKPAGPATAAGPQPVTVV